MFRRGDEEEIVKCGAAVIEYTYNWLLQENNPLNLGQETENVIRTAHCFNVACQSSQLYP